jgi:IQ calmodulin-binding motif
MICIQIIIIIYKQVANIERQVASRVAAAALSANTLLTTHSSSQPRTAIPSDSAAVHDPKPAALNSSSHHASAISSSIVVRDSGARMSGNREDAAVAVQARYRGYRARKGTASGESSLLHIEAAKTGHAECLVKVRCCIVCLRICVVYLYVQVSTAYYA